MSRTYRRIKDAHNKHFYITDRHGNPLEGNETLRMSAWFHSDNFGHRSVPVEFGRNWKKAVRQNTRKALHDAVNDVDTVFGNEKQIKYELLWWF